MDFQEFPKIARFSRDIIVTEKIDGTNACIGIEEVPPEDAGLTSDEMEPALGCYFDDAREKHFFVYAGSRSRWLTRDDDHYGFASWVHDHIEDVLTLGEGRHFGEWWGSGIQRRYGLTGEDKRLSFFNVQRWALHGMEPQPIPTLDASAEPKFQDVLPPCIGLVPELYRGPFYTQQINECLDRLQSHGSVAAPGFMNPEGVVIFHTAGNVGFKKTLLKDEVPKGRR